MQCMMVPQMQMSRRVVLYLSKLLSFGLFSDQEKTAVVSCFRFPFYFPILIDLAESEMSRGRQVAIDSSQKIYHTM